MMSIPISRMALPGAYFMHCMALLILASSGPLPGQSSDGFPGRAGAGPAIRHTASISWQPYGGPFGGDISGMYLTQSGTILARNSPSGLFRSSDNGSTWADATQGFPKSAGSGVYGIFPGGINEVYAVSEGLLYRSTTDGVSWQHVPTSADSLVWNFARSRSGTLFVTDNNHIFRSTNNGTSWQMLTDTLAKAGMLLVTRTGRIISMDLQTGYFTSTDNGSTWSQKPWPFSAVSAVAMDSSGTLYASGTTTAYLNETVRSADDGVTWNAISPNLFVSLTVNPGNVLYAVSSDVFTSTDLGSSWTKIRTEDLYAEGGITSVVANAAGDVFIGSFLGMERRLHGSNSWVMLNSGLSGHSIQQAVLDSSRNIIARNYFGWRLHTSTDNGGHWADGGPQYYQSMNSTQSMTVSPLHTILAPFGNRVYRSATGGASWTMTTLVREAFDGYKILSLPDGKIFIGTDSIIYRSTDDGFSWSLYNAGLPPETNVNHLSAAANGDLLCASQQGVFRLPAGGSLWQAVDTTGLPNPHVIRVAANGSGDLFAVSSDVYDFSTIQRAYHGVFRKLASGGVWQRIAAGMTDTLVTALAIHRRSGQLFAGTLNGNIFYSADNGNSWLNASSGYAAHVRVNSMDFLGDSLLVISSAGAGLFRSVNPVPVELSSFSAEKRSDGVQLSWSTAVENGDFGFFVERRTPQSASWEAVAFVPGMGSSSIGRSYRHLDPLIRQDFFPAEYRLKQMDFDGSYIYSPVIVVQGDEALPESIRMQILPNPLSADAVISLSLPGERELRISFVNSGGRTVMELPGQTLPGGTSAIPFRRGTLPAGVYFCFLSTSAGERSIEKLVVR